MTVEFPESYYTGGLVGFSFGSVQNSYATGAVTGGRYAGGAAGAGNFLSTSYSTGAVSGAYPGGFIGFGDDDFSDYWDVTTSGTDVGVGEGNSTGVTGLTSQQLQAGLPAGFDPTIWGQNANINNGLPYLLANPPPQ
ncbi:MAG TPA: GLUG motif-containing protein [Rhizomicrobium sp.]|nr:GLUG motif-containing protein [Rhizomicrobium sp.]